MAINVKQYDPNQQQITCVNAHSSGDFCYEGGYYGIAKLNNLAGASNTLIIAGNVNVPVPTSTVVGSKLYTASQPAGALALTLTASSNVLVAMAKTARDTNGFADVTLLPYQSMGN